MRLPSLLLPLQHRLSRATGAAAFCALLPVMPFGALFASPQSPLCHRRGASEPPMRDEHPHSMSKSLSKGWRSSGVAS